MITIFRLKAAQTLPLHEDVAKRFEAYGWHVQVVEDGNDIHGH